MPLQNRIRPDGEIVAEPGRGLFMGNRGGRLHDDDRQLGSRRWAGKAWICCLTQFKGRHRTVMSSGYTELFFLDEAAALAAGHRPCFECRRADAVRFAETWNGARGLVGRAAASDMDDILHGERIGKGGMKRTHVAMLSTLPAGAMVIGDGQMLLWHRDLLWPWSMSGYGLPRAPVGDGACVTLTPPSVIAVLGAGYPPVLHGSAQRGSMEQEGA